MLLGIYIYLFKQSYVVKRYKFKKVLKIFAVLSFRYIKLTKIFEGGGKVWIKVDLLLN